MPRGYAAQHDSVVRIKIGLKNVGVIYERTFFHRRPIGKKSLDTKESTTSNQNTHLGEEGPLERRIMMSCSKSQKEAAGLTPLLNTRTALKLGTWNIRTMFDTGRMVQVAQERKMYGLQVLGLSETRWLGMGQMKLATGEQLIYSGHTEDGVPHTECVAFMLLSLFQQALVGWELVSPRIVCAQFLMRKKGIKLNVIQCYAPTNDADEDKKVFTSCYRM